jgi:hypothetical protein
MRRTRCLYCGSSYWRPLKWLRDGEFCCKEHRESYQGRLRKIAGTLTESQPSPEVLPQSQDSDFDLRPVSSLLQSQPAPDTFPQSQDPDVRPQPAPSLLESEPAPETLPQSQDPDAGLQPVSSLLASFLPLSKDISARSPVDRGRASTETLPPTFESRARIRRWGLLIRFFH